MPYGTTSCSVELRLRVVAEFAAACAHAEVPSSILESP
jgi:hypothetical protein